MKTTNKLTTIGIIVAIIGIIVSIFLSQGGDTKQVIQSTSGDKSPAINSNGNVSVNIK